MKKGTFKDFFSVKFFYFVFENLILEIMKDGSSSD